MGSHKFQKKGKKWRVLYLVFVFMSTDRTNLQLTYIRVKQNKRLLHLLQLNPIYKEFTNSYLIKNRLKKNIEKKRAPLFFVTIFRSKLAIYELNLSYPLKEIIIRFSKNYKK